VDTGKRFQKSDGYPVPVFATRAMPYVHIDFINPSDIKMKHDEICIHDERECGVRLVVSVGNIQNEQTPSPPFLFRSSVVRLIIDW